MQQGACQVDPGFELLIHIGNPTAPPLIRQPLLRGVPQEAQKNPDP